MCIIRFSAAATGTGEPALAGELPGRAPQHNTSSSSHMQVVRPVAKTLSAEMSRWVHAGSALGVGLRSTTIGTGAAIRVRSGQPQPTITSRQRDTERDTTATEAK